MRRYMNADLHRIFTRIPRYISLAVLYALLTVIAFAYFKESTSYEFVSFFGKYDRFVFFLFGLIDFVYVYTDDFKAKTMQIAIGTGISRRNVVLAKWADVAVLTLVNTVILGLLIVLAAACRGIAFTSDMMGSYIILLFFGWLRVIGSVGFTMIFMFWTQNPTIGMLVYILEGIGLIGELFSMLLSANFLEKLRISGYTFTGLLKLSRSRMMLGSFNFWYALGIVLYLAAFYFLACFAFRRRELEF